MGCDKHNKLEVFSQFSDPSEEDEPNYYQESINDGSLKESVNNFIFLHGNESMTLKEANAISEDLYYKLIGDKGIEGMNSR